METWSGIYLRTGLALPAVAGAAGVAVFHGAMLAGRTSASILAGRSAPSTRLRLAGIAAAADQTTAGATHTATTAGEVSRTANELSELVSHFTLA